VHARSFDTPHGPANAFVHPAAGARGAIVLGHGAGGSVAARDLTTVREVAVEHGFTAVLVEQPYRVAGRRSPAPAAQLDAAWVSVVEQLRASELHELPLVTGGRSSGARVACRTAAPTAAAGVICLAFPLQPAARAGTPPPPSRLPELAGVTVPVLVVQGLRDPFGMPPVAPGREVVGLAGDHRLATDLPGLASAVEVWLARV
jgi:uncharacterized protein